MRFTWWGGSREEFGKGEGRELGEKFGEYLGVGREKGMCKGGIFIGFFIYCLIVWDRDSESVLGKVVFDRGLREVREEFT